MVNLNDLLFDDAAERPVVQRLCVFCGRPFTFARIRDRACGDCDRPPTLDDPAWWWWKDDSPPSNGLNRSFKSEAATSTDAQIADAIARMDAALRGSQMTKQGRRVVIAQRRMYNRERLLRARLAKERRRILSGLPVRALQRRRRAPPAAPAGHIGPSSPMTSVQALLALRECQHLEAVARSRTSFGGRAAETAEPPRPEPSP